MAVGTLWFGIRKGTETTLFRDVLNKDRDCLVGFLTIILGEFFMEISKFIVGVLAIAIGLWAAGELAPATLSMASKAIEAQKDHSDFKLGDWNRRLNR